MADTITLNKALFARSIGSLFFPNPDDPGDPGNPWGPYGPGGPVSRRALLSVLDAISWVALNPQPLPPESDPTRLGPQPEPWRHAQLAGLAASKVINRVIEQVQMAEVLGGQEQADRSMEQVQSMLQEIVDDYCGTTPRRWRWPGPPRRAGEAGVFGYLVAGAQFQNAAQLYSGTQFGEIFARSADQLFETAAQVG